MSLLHEIQRFFKGEGFKFDQGTSCIYSVKARDAFTSVVLPRMVDRESLDWVDFPADLAPIDPELKLPPVKYDNIWYSCLILKYLADGHKAKAKENVDRLIM